MHTPVTELETKSLQVGEPKEPEATGQEAEEMVEPRQPQHQVVLAARGQPPIPLEVEQDIVSHLSIEVPSPANEGGQISTTSSSDAQCETMEALLQRLGNLFPENQGSSQRDCCCICKTEAIFYPYKLADCGHVACGRCIYTTAVGTAGHAIRGSCQLCGQAIRNKPHRVENFQLYHAQSQWTLDDKDYNSLLNTRDGHNGGVVDGACTVDRA